MTVNTAIRPCQYVMSVLYRLRDSMATKPFLFNYSVWVLAKF